MQPFASYVICTAPRSGSTLLCSLLAATGVAGKPASYFHDPSIDEWFAELGLPPVPEKPERDRLDIILKAAIKAGRGSSRIFGLRLQAHGLGFLCQKLALLFPQAQGDAARFRRAFGPVLFIHLTRPDKVAQAVSYLKAEQTGLWHMAPDGSELERLSPPQEPAYDGARLKDIMTRMQAHDHDWSNWFAREGITPLHLSYDDLEIDPLSVLRRVLDALGLEPSAANDLQPGVRKLADQTSRDWAARFRAETG